MTLGPDYDEAVNVAGQALFGDQVSLGQGGSVSRALAAALPLLPETAEAQRLRKALAEIEGFDYETLGVEYAREIAVNALGTVPASASSDDGRFSERVEAAVERHGPVLDRLDDTAPASPALQGDGGRLERSIERALADARNEPIEDDRELAGYVAQAIREDTAVPASVSPAGELPSIEIMPGRSSGQPTIGGRRLTTATVAAAINDGYSDEDVARDYEVTPEQVQLAVAFERGELAAVPGSVSPAGGDKVFVERVLDLPGGPMRAMVEIKDAPAPSVSPGDGGQPTDEQVEAAARVLFADAGGDPEAVDDDFRRIARDMLAAAAVVPEQPEGELAPLWASPREKDAAAAAVLRLMLAREATDPGDRMTPRMFARRIVEVLDFAPSPVQPRTEDEPFAPYEPRRVTEQEMRQKIRDGIDRAVAPQLGDDDYQPRTEPQA